MARLIYAAITSLDGYMGDRDGNFEWSVPTAEVFAAVLELERPIGTYLYGRRMYETMAVWETAHLDAGTPIGGVVAEPCVVGLCAVIAIPRRVGAMRLATSRRGSSFAGRRQPAAGLRPARSQRHRRRDDGDLRWNDRIAGPGRGRL
jgi:hypothetical protein